MCLSIGTPRINGFSICPKFKIYYFLMSQNLDILQPNYNVSKYWDTCKNINFPFGTNGKLMVLGVPIFKHFRVVTETVFLTQCILVDHSTIICWTKPICHCHFRGVARSILSLVFYF